ncbi:hypothetical protein BJ742DRAFT_813616 [Cladochytrium replicatum]|nr:hypothetical protein BJ742DRAFT_813616 [Cladochytrium replicatum]
MSPLNSHLSLNPNRLNPLAIPGTQRPSHCSPLTFSSSHSQPFVNSVPLHFINSQLPTQSLHLTAPLQTRELVSQGTWSAPSLHVPHTLQQHSQHQNVNCLFNLSQPVVAPRNAYNPENNNSLQLPVNSAPLNIHQQHSVFQVDSHSQHMDFQAPRVIPHTVTTSLPLWQDGNNQPNVAASSRDANTFMPDLIGFLHSDPASLLLGGVTQQPFNTTQLVSQTEKPLQTNAVSLFHGIQGETSGFLQEFSLTHQPQPQTHYHQQQLQQQLPQHQQQQQQQSRSFNTLNAWPFDFSNNVSNNATPLSFEGLPTTTISTLPLPIPLSRQDSTLSLNPSTLLDTTPTPTVLPKPQDPTPTAPQPSSDTPAPDPSDDAVDSESSPEPEDPPVDDSDSDDSTYNPTLSASSRPRRTVTARQSHPQPSSRRGQHHQQQPYTTPIPSDLSAVAHLERNPQTGHFHCPAPMCQRSFDRKFNLRTHYASTHARLRAFECEVCERSFARRYDLQRHVRLLHPGRG